MIYGNTKIRLIVLKGVYYPISRGTKQGSKFEVRTTEKEKEKKGLAYWYLALVLKTLFNIVEAWFNKLLNFDVYMFYNDVQMDQ